MKKPLRVYIGWVGIIILGLNKFCYPKQFLYSREYSFFTSGLSGFIIYMILMGLALEFINFTPRKNKNNKP